jgi:hypothetical protein
MVKMLKIVTTMLLCKQELVWRDICGVWVWLISQRCNNFLAALVLDDWTRSRGYETG